MMAVTVSSSKRVKPFCFLWKLLRRIIKRASFLKKLDYIELWMYMTMKEKEKLGLHPEKAGSPILDN